MTIKIITEPSVYLVGRQEVDERELGRFLADVDAPSWTTDAPSDAEKLVEIAGRQCYDSFKKGRPGGNAAYINRILDEGHGSVLEHAVWTLAVSGISRSLSHQLVRHRHISPSQLSQRFVDESSTAFVVPPAMVGEVSEGMHYLRCKGGDFAIASMHILEDEVPASTRAGFDWLKAMDWSLAEYGSAVEYLTIRDSPESFTPDLGNFCQTFPIAQFQADKTTARKRAREAARSVLPEAVETRMVLTGNARAWRNLIEQRGTAHADAEIRRLTLAILKVLQVAAPNIFGDYTVTEVANGVSIATTPHRKV